MKIVSLDGVVVDRREGSRRIVPPLALGRIFGRRRLRHLPVLLCSLDHLLCGHYCGATFAPAGSQASLNRLVDRVNALDVPQLLHQSRFWLNKRQRAGEALLESALCNSRGARPAGRMPTGERPHGQHAQQVQDAGQVKGGSRTMAHPPRRCSPRPHASERCPCQSGDPR